MNKTTLKVIISPSYGSFMPNRSLAKQLKLRGYHDWSTIDARTDQVIIDYIEKQIEKAKMDFNIGFLGTSKDQYLIIREVKTDSPWTITQHKGSESIRYLAYEIIDSQTNYGRELCNAEVESEQLN